MLCATLAAATLRGAWLGYVWIGIGEAEVPGELD